MYIYQTWSVLILKRKRKDVLTNCQPKCRMCSERVSYMHINIVCFKVALLFSINKFRKKICYPISINILINASNEGICVEF